MGEGRSPPPPVRSYNLSNITLLHTLVCPPLRLPPSRAVRFGANQSHGREADVHKQIQVSTKIINGMLCQLVDYWVSTNIFFCKQLNLLCLFSSRLGSSPNSGLAQHRAKKSMPDQCKTQPKVTPGLSQTDHYPIGDQTHTEQNRPRPIPSRQEYKFKTVPNGPKTEFW